MGASAAPDGDPHAPARSARRLRPWRAAVRWFDDLTRRPKSRWWQAWLVLVVAVLTLGMHEQRGTAYAVAAAVGYGALFVPSARRPDRLAAWSGRHPWLDSLVILPATFLGLAFPTDLAAGAMAALAVVVWLAVVGIRLVRQDRASSSGGRPG